MTTIATITRRTGPKILTDLLGVVPKRRWATSAAASANANSSIKTSISGRSRFYKQVNIKPLNVPWDTTSSNSKDSSNDDNVKSPISAGVDGTQSATGVHHIPLDNDTISLTKMLKPRCPGVEYDNDDNNNNNDNQNKSWYGVTLDGRKISTPMGQTLAVPSETLAMMIAAEWDSQLKQIQPSNMPLMTLACTTLDQAALHPKHYRDEAINFLRTDTTCFWADPTEDRLLHRRQKQAWQGLHDFCCDRLGGSSPTTALGIEGILMTRKRGSEKPQTGLPHPEILTELAIKWIYSLDAWQLVALNSIANQAKSFLIAFAILESNGLNISNNNVGKVVCPFPDITKVSEACRVEEEFQISCWGLVEGGHDYDRLNCNIQLQSANLFSKTILLEN
jgi:ATP synthase F1 complex assembly factor 2